MKRISWFLLILGISLGTIFGLYYAWEIGPIDPKEAVPADLQAHFQEEVRTLIAIAYANTGDINRAIRRLDLLSDPGTAQSLSALAQQHLADGRPEEDVRAVAQLAAALAAQDESPTTPQSPSTTATSSASATLPPSVTPLPTPTPTLIPNFQLLSKEEICDPELMVPLIQVVIHDRVGDSVPGIEVFIVWDNGNDHFYTGLKPEGGLGYGDFTMTEGITYSLQVTDMGVPIPGLGNVECLTEDEIPFLGSWMLVFEEP